MSRTRAAGIQAEFSLEAVTTQARTRAAGLQVEYSLLDPFLLDDIETPDTWEGSAARVGDEGGWRILVNGRFSPGEEFSVVLIDGDAVEHECIGYVDNDFTPTADAEGVQVEVFTPPLELGSYDLRITETGSSRFDLLLGALTVLRRSFVTNAYDLRTFFPPPRYAGARRPQDEGQDF